MQYLALTTRGLEEIGKLEIQEKIKDVQFLDISYRKIVFESDADLDSILSLRSVEDIFIEIDRFKNIGHTQSDFSALIYKVSTLDFRKALSQLESIRTPKSFSISYSSVGKRNFTSTQVKEKLGPLLQKKLHLDFEDEKHDDFDIRIFLEHENAFIGVRISQKPLHRRDYKQDTSEGSLKSSIGYSLCALADLNQDDIVLDPLCGSGTILIESKSFNPQKVIGGDINPKAIEISKKNISSNESKIHIEEWDATKLPIADQSITKIITNLPFGKQVKIESDIGYFYSKLLSEFVRVIKRKGKIVILTNQNKEFKKSLNQFPNLHNEKEINISLHGEQCFIYILRNL